MSHARGFERPVPRWSMSTMSRPAGNDDQGIELWGRFKGTQNDQPNVDGSTCVSLAVLVDGVGAALHVALYAEHGTGLQCPLAWDGF